MLYEDFIAIMRNEPLDFVQATTDVGHLVDNLGAAYARMPDEVMRRRMVDFIGLTGRPPWD